MNQWTKRDRINLRRYLKKEVGKITSSEWTEMNRLVTKQLDALMAVPTLGVFGRWSISSRGDLPYNTR